MQLLYASRGVDVPSLVDVLISDECDLLLQVAKALEEQAGELRDGFLRLEFAYRQHDIARPKARVGLFEDRDVKALLAPKIVINKLFIEIRARRDLIDPRTSKTLVGELVPRGNEQPAACPFRIAPLRFLAFCSAYFAAQLGRALYVDGHSASTIGS